MEKDLDEGPEIGCVIRTLSDLESALDNILDEAVRDRLVTCLLHLLKDGSTHSDTTAADRALQAELQASESRGCEDYSASVKEATKFALDPSERAENFKVLLGLDLEVIAIIDLYQEAYRKGKRPLYFDGDSVLS